MRLSLMVVLAAALAGCAAAPTAEDPKLTSYAYEEMKAGKYEAALNHFRARVKAAPADANAWFLGAATLNRLGRYADAARIFAAYAKAGGHNPELAYEQGVSLLGARRAAEAVPLLEGYRKAHPASAKASLALGVAYLAERQFEPAAAAFNQAMAVPAAKPRALFWLAVLEKGRKDDGAARRYLDTLLAEAPDSREVATLRKVAELVAKQKAAGQ